MPSFWYTGTDMDPNILPPGENITEKQLKWGYWFVTHKLEIRKWFTFAVMAIGALLWLFTIGMLVKLFLVDYTGYRTLLRELPVSLVNPAAIQAALPHPLDVRPVTVLEGAKGTSDLMLTVTNPNDDYWASWDGRFIAMSATTTAKREFILPGETKEFVDLGIESAGRVSAPRYDLAGLTWHKIDKHAIPDIARYYADRFRFEVKDIEFKNETSADGASSISRVTFFVTNRSAYSYWSVKFLANLYRGTTLAAVNSVELQQLETGETRRVDMVWVQELQAISKVEVIPQVNVLEAKSFMPQRAN